MPNFFSFPKCQRTWWLILLFYSLLGSVAFAQQPNEICTTALPFPAIPTDGINCATVTGSFTNSFGAGGTICGGQTIARDLWYIFTVPIGYTSVVYTTAGLAGGPDPYIQVLSGDCPGTALLCSTQPSGTITGLTNATTYLLRVFIPIPSNAEFEVCLKVAPPNDECANAIAFPTIPTDGTCATVNINTSGASGTSSATCGGAEDDDLWYTFTMPMGFTSLSYANIDISGETDRWLQIFNGSCGGASVGCFDAESGTITGLTGGATYVLRAYTDRAGAGRTSNFDLCLSVTPSNDNCTNAIAFPTIPADGTCASVTANTIGATGTPMPGCLNGAEDDVWYSFTVPLNYTSLLYNLTTINGDGDHTLQLRSACVGGTVTCYTDESGTLTDLVGGTTYLLRAFTNDQDVYSVFDICLQVPPLGNDFCAGAFPFPSIPTNGLDCATVTGNTTDATGGPTACSNPAFNDLWYYFTVPVGYTSIVYSIANTAGGNTPYLQIFSGNCPGASLGCFQPASGTITGLTAGTTYLLRIYTPVAADIDFSICLKVVPPNDECVNAIAFPAIPTDGGCSTITINTAGATNSGVAMCGGSNNDLWYTFTVPVGFTAITYTNTTISGDDDRTIQVFDGCGGNSLGCFTDESGTITGLIGGNTYWLRVYSPTAGPGPARYSTFDLCLTVVPTNDNCAGAIAFPTIPLTGTCATVTVNTAGATGNPSGACVGDEDDDLWYSFTVPAGYTSLLYTMTNISGSSNHVMGIGSACGNTAVGCFDAESGTITGLIAGNTYYLRAYTFDLDVFSTFDICLQVPPPVNDNCAGAIAFPTIPTNGNCATVTVNNAGATGSSMTCPGTADDDLWYSFTMPAATSSISYTITTNSGSAEHAFQIISGGCFGVSVGCFNAETGTITVPNAGATYLMRVYTTSADVLSNFDICLNAVALPLELKSFTGEIKGSINVLYWETLTEKNVQFHVVERSIDGINWQEIGRKNGFVNSTVSTKYALEDRSPLPKAYYRLRSVDLHGQESISSSILLVRKGDSFGIISIFPSPTKDNVTVQFNAVQEESMIVQVLDMTGRLVLSKTIEAKNDINEMPLELNSLQAGIYTVIIINSGGVSVPARFVKQ